MSVFITPQGQIGLLLAERLGLALPKREGHDLAGPCIACQSSDAFRLHAETGVAQCYSCQGKWSPFQLAEAVLKDRDRAKSLLVELGVFKPNANGHSPLPAQAADPISDLARIIHALRMIYQNRFPRNELRPSCPKHHVFGRYLKTPH